MPVALYRVVMRTSRFEKRRRRMNRRVEPVRALLEPERVEDTLAELLLLLRLEGLLEELRSTCGACCTSAASTGRSSRRPPPPRREHVRLVVVEEWRVRRVLPFEAVDVLSLELEVALERRRTSKSLVARGSIQTWLPSAAARQLDAELRRNAALLLPVAARHPDEAGVVGVVVERLLERTEALEDAAELLVHEPLVHDLAQRRQLVGTCGIAARHRTF